MKKFELFIQPDYVYGKDWERLIDKIKQYEKNFTFEIVFEENCIEFYFYAKKDLTILATKLEGFLIKPINGSQEDEDKFIKRINSRLPLNKNILESIEGLKLKKRLTLRKVRIDFIEILGIKLQTRMQKY